jgi:hypothetical protein
MSWYRLLVPFVCVLSLVPAAWGQDKKEEKEEEKVPLVVLERVDAAELKLKDVGDPAVSYPLTVENRGPAEVKKLEVIVSSFVSPGGDSVSPTLSITNSQTSEAAPGSSVTIDVPAGGSVPLRLEAVLPKAATYRAVVRLVSGGKVLVNFPIEIARTKSQQPVEIGDLPAAQVTAGFLHGVFSHSFQATAYSTGGTAVLHPPVLQSATRKPKSDSAAGVAASLQLGPGSPVTVAPGPPQEVPFKILNLQGPGRYDATIRFPASGYQPIEKTVTVYVRDSAWVAVMWIALGVLVSLLVHAYTARIRPRLVVQQRVSAMFADLNALQTHAGGDEASRELVQQVSNNIANRWDELGRKRRAPTAEEFDLFDEIVQNLRPWIELRRQLLATRPASISRKLMPALEKAKGAFTRADPVAADVQASVKDLEDLPAKIRDEVIAELRIQLQSFEAELKKDSRPEVKTILDKLPQVVKQLDQGDVKAALSALDLIRGDYLRLLAEDLKIRINATQPPTGVEPDKWRELTAAIQKDLADLDEIVDSEEKMQAFRGTLKSYLTVVLESLGAFAVAKIPANARLAINKKLLDVKKEIEAGNLASAWRNLEALEKEISSKAQAGAMGGAEAAAADALKAAVAPAAAVGALDLIDIVDAAPPSEVLRRAGAAPAAERRIGTFDLLLTAVVLLVAIAIGLQALWTDNPTWGGWQSYLAAFVWGFALDQFTHAGVLALRPGK